MKLILKCWLIFISVSLVQTTFAQTDYRQLKMDADDYFSNELFREALFRYLRLDSIKPNDGQINARIGICYLESSPKQKALKYLEKAREQKYTKDEIDYYYAYAWHLEHDFDKAISLYQSAKKKTKFKKDDIDENIKRCLNGKELIKDPVEVVIENLGAVINTPYPEYAPVISANEKIMIFTSRRPGSTGGLIDIDGGFFEDIYVSYNVNGEWTKPVNVPGEVNTPTNDASIGFSADGGELFIYKNDTVNVLGGNIYLSKLVNDKWTAPEKLNKNINTKGWEPSASMSADENFLFFTSDRPGGYGGTDIYVSRRLPDKQWGPAKNLGPTVNTPYDEDAPFIHADGKTLYFSSKGHNSMGGFDVFTTQYDRANDSVTVPQNVGYPINTADDELFFVWSADGTKGYFSAVRDDTEGDYDIYMIKRNNVQMSLILFNGKVVNREEIAIPAKITIIDNETNNVVAVYDSTQFIGDYTITLEPGKNYAVSIESNQYLSHSENIFIPLNGFHDIKKDIVMTPLDKGGLIVLNNVFFEIGSAELKKSSEAELERYIDLVKESPELLIEIAGHAFDLDSHKENLVLSQKRAEAVVDYLVNNGLNKEQLRAVGYGDRFRISDDESPEGILANSRTELIIIENLQKNAAASLDSEHFYVQNEVVREGSMIKVTSKGEDKLVTLSNNTVVKKAAPTQASQSKPSGSSTAPVQNYLVKKEQQVYLPFDSTAYQGEVDMRKEVETMVLSGTLKPFFVKGTVKDGKALPLKAKVQLYDNKNFLIKEVTCSADGSYIFETFSPKDTWYTVTASFGGYGFANKDVKILANTDEEQDVRIDFTLSELAKGMTFRLRNIYFDFNKFHLNPESHKELKKLEDLLRNNSLLVIEIGGHTDAMGGAAYNKLLSQKRCESVVNYLVSRGVDRGRLQAKGYGASRPLASNDDEEEGRELNRRIEFTIVSNEVVLSR